MADAKTEKQKVKEITDKLEEGLKELFESEKYKSYLSTMSKFHNYSFNNTLLIVMQKPEATLVAGYQAWQKNFNRHVNKGERGIRILAPAPYKIKEERDKLDPVTGEVMLDKDGTPQTEEVKIKIPAFRAVSVNNMVIGGIFCAGGKSKFECICDGIVLWLIVILAASLAAFYFHLPVLAVYFILCLDECIKVPVVFWYYRRYTWAQNLTK